MPSRNASVVIRDAIHRALQLHKVLADSKKLVVAVSGGADSLALLQGLSDLRNPLNLDLHVAHFDHGLREDSLEDASFVQRVAKQMEMPITVGGENVEAYAKSYRLSIEDAARRCRYAFLARVGQEVGANAIALGHTSDDQVETVLLHLVRGSSLRGLRGMAVLTRLLEPSTQQYLRLFRPLLAIGRETTEAVCREVDIQPREDPSNQSLRFTRNRLRLEILPLLREINPAVREALLRLARTAQEDEAYLHAETVGYTKAVHRQADNALHLDREAFRTMPLVLQRRLLQMTYQELMGPSHSLDQDHLDGMLHLMDGAPGNRLNLPGGVVFSMGYGEFLLGPDPETMCPLPPLEYESTLNLQGTTILEGWDVETTITEGRPDRDYPDGVTQVVLDADAIGGEPVIRARQAGDRFQPIGMSGRKKLQDFFVDAKVPRPWRNRIPLVVGKEGIAWVVGYRIAQWAKVTSQTRRVAEITFHRSDDITEAD
jgi:tRNA(Ile)-lysidine synthase